MIISEQEKNRINSFSDIEALEEWLQRRYGELYISCEYVVPSYAEPSDEILTAEVRHYANEKKERIISTRYQLKRVKDMYLIWLSEHTNSDGKIMTDEELSKSLSGKTMGEIMRETSSDRKATVDTETQEQVYPNRSRMLTVQKLIDYLKTQNPDACIVAYEENSFGYIEQFPELPSDCICTVAEDKKRQTEFYLTQWYRDYPEEEKKKRCKENINETYRYCKDDDIIIKF